MRWKHRNSDFFTVLPHHFAGSNAFAHEHQANGSQAGGSESQI
jgi:hypothetical protein